MGLRETKAARTREQILDVALPLFLDRGFDDVTMEEIAERSEVGTSTLYRYFPSKDLILLDRFRETGVIATRLRERPVDEPLELALALAITATLDAVSSDDRRMLAVRDIIDRTPGPRARLWDFVAQDRELLQDAVAERTGRDRDDVGVALTARVALLIYELAADTWRTSDHRVSPAAVAATIIDRLTGTGITLPRLPAER